MGGVEWFIVLFGGYVLIFKGIPYWLNTGKRHAEEVKRIAEKEKKEAQELASAEDIKLELEEKSRQEAADREKEAEEIRAEKEKNAAEKLAKKEMQTRISEEIEQVHVNAIDKVLRELKTA